MAESDTEHKAGMDTPAEIHIEHIQTQTQTQDDENRPLTWSLALAVVSLALGFVGPIMVISLLASVITQVTTKLGDTKDQSWPISAFSVCGAVSFSVAGNLSDTFGRRLVIIVGNILMAVGAIVGAAAHSVHQLIVAECVIGFASGLIFVGYASISELLPNKWRGAGVGLTEFLVTVPWNLTSTLIAVSIYSNTALSWRWFYIIAAIYATLSLVGIILFYFPPTRPSNDYDKTRWEEFKEIDFVGCLLFGGGLCVTLVGLTWAGTEHPWKSAAVIAPIVIGVCSILCAFIYDNYVPVSPLFPTNLILEIRKYVLLLVVAFVAGFIYYSMSALLPQATLFVFTNDPIKIGITQIPNGMGQLLLGSMASAAIGVVGHLRLQIVFWTTMMVVCTACLAATLPHSKAAFMALQPFAVGPFPTITALTIVIASLNIPLRYLGLAVGLIGTLRSAGGSVGNTVLQTILNSVVNDKLGPAIIDATVQLGFDPQHAGELIGATVQNAVGVPFAFEAVPGATLEVQRAAAEALRVVYAYAFRRVFYAVIPFGVIAIICAVFVHDPSLQLTNHTAVRMEREGLMRREKNHSNEDSYESKTTGME